MTNVNRLYKIQRISDGKFSAGGSKPVFTKDGKAWDCTKRFMAHLQLFKYKNRELYDGCKIVSYDLVPATDEEIVIDDVFHDFEEQEIVAKLAGNKYW